MSDGRSTAKHFLEPREPCSVHRGSVFHCCLKRTAASCMLTLSDKLQPEVDKAVQGDGMVGQAFVLAHPADGDGGGDPAMSCGECCCLDARDILLHKGCYTAAYFSWCLRPRDASIYGCVTIFFLRQTTARGSVHPAETPFDANPDNHCRVWKYRVRLLPACFAAGKWEDTSWRLLESSWLRSRVLQWK